jgi:hypothetical protein
MKQIHRFFFSTFAIFYFIFFSIFSQKIFSDVVDQKTIEELDSRISTLEIKRALDRIRFGLNFGTMAYYSDAKKMDVGFKNSLAYTNQFKLLFSGDVSDNLSFYGAAQSYFNWNDRILSNNVNDPNLSNQTGRSNQLEIIRSYFEYKMFDKTFSISAGRLPTTEGPPFHLRNGLHRQGTYPALIYSVPFDGVAFTWNAHKTLGMNSTLISRTILSPGSSHKSDVWKAMEFGRLSGKFVGNNSGGFQMIEFEKSDFEKFSDQLLFVLQGGFARFNAPGNAIATGVLRTTYNDDNDTYLISSTNGRLFDLTLLGSYLELLNIYKTKIDFYASWMKEWVHNTGGLEISVYDAGFPGGLNAATPRGTIISTVTTTSAKKTQANRILLGSRYELLSSLHVGGEFMHASDESLGVAAYSDLAGSIYRIKGDMYHLYFNKMFFGDKFNTKFGYLNILERKRDALLTAVTSHNRFQVFYIGASIRL